MDDCADPTKVLAPAAKRKPPAAGIGRKKGVPNKTTQAVKDMILAALDKAGGVEYLARQADENPGPFLTLVGKVLPLQVNGGMTVIGMPAITIPMPTDGD